MCVGVCLRGRVRVCVLACVCVRARECQLARLYLISDIFHNCSITSIPEKNLWSYRQYFEWHLPYIFEVINRAQAYAVKNEGLKGDVFKEKIMRLLQIWNDWAIFDYHYM